MTNKKISEIILETYKKNLYAAIDKKKWFRAQKIREKIQEIENAEKKTTNDV